MQGRRRRRLPCRARGAQLQREQALTECLHGGARAGAMRRPWRALLRCGGGAELRHGQPRRSRRAADAAGQPRGAGCSARRPCALQYALRSVRGEAEAGVGHGWLPHSSPQPGCQPPQHQHSTASALFSSAASASSCAARSRSCSSSCSSCGDGDGSAACRKGRAGRGCWAASEGPASWGVLAVPPAHLHLLAQAVEPQLECRPPLLPLVVDGRLLRRHGLVGRDGRFRHRMPPPPRDALPQV